MRSILVGVALCAVLFVSGCGGGGTGGPSSSSGGADQTFSQGSLTFTAKAGAKPLVLGGGTGGINLIAISGASFTSVLASLPHTLNNTFLAFGSYGQVWTADPSFGSVNEPVTVLPVQGESFPSVNALGRIAYHRMDNGLGQIYVANADGTGNHRISDGVHDDTSPSWLPDNSNLVFERAGQIYKMNSSGSGVVSLDDQTTTDMQPAVSVNGTIAFVRLNAALSEYGIWTMNSAGNLKASVRSLGAVSFSQPSWSPDGTRLLYVENDGSTQYIVEQVLTGGLSPISIPSSSYQDVWPVFSADGRSIYFGRNTASGSFIYKCAPDGLSPGSVYTVPAGATLDRLCWSPYLANKLFVGSGGSFGATSNGFVLAQQGTAISSFFTAVASAGGTVTITPDTLNPNIEHAVPQSGATIATCSYTNGLFTSPATVTTTGAKQVVITYDPSGQVSLLLPVVSKVNPVVSKSGSSTVLKGRFSGVFDAKGENLAANGATTVTVDSKTGKCSAAY